LDIPTIAVFTSNDGEYTSHEVTGSGQLDADVYSILQGSARSEPMPDLSVEQFFHHADVLSGQDVGKVSAHRGAKLDRLDLTDGGFIERAVTALDATRAGDTTSIWTDLKRTFLTDGTDEGSLWHHWTGQTADEAKEKFTSVGKWFAQDGSDGVFRQDALRAMSGILIKYAATIHGARMNLNNLMGELVDQVNEWNDKSPAGSAGKWVSLSEIKNVAEGTPLGHVFKVVDAVAQAADTLTAEKELKEDQVYTKLTSYLESADGIVRNAVDEVGGILRDLDTVREGRHARDVDIPVWDQ
jgi:hypothetical protein